MRVAHKLMVGEDCKLTLFPSLFLSFAILTVQPGQLIPRDLLNESPIQRI